MSIIERQILLSPLPSTETSTNASVSGIAVDTIPFATTTVSSISATRATVVETISSTETVGLTTQPASVNNSSLSSATARTSSSSSTTLPRVSSNPSTSSSSSSLRLGLIIGGVVAVVLSLILFLLLVWRHRASRRRLRAEADPTPFDPFDTSERLGVNDNGLSSELELPRALPRPAVYSSQIIPPANAKSDCNNYTVHSSIHGERAPLVLEYTSDPNPQAGGRFKSNSSRNLITNAINTPTYIPAQRPNRSHLPTEFTNDFAPPAYDSLSTRNFRVQP